MQPTAPEADARPGMEARLRRVALRLWARQWLGALPSVLCWMSAGVVAALLLLVLGPRLLFGGALLAPPVALALGAGAGLVIGLLGAARHLRRPTLAETALALESRLAGPDASLSTLLETSGSFHAPLAARANLEFQAALAAPAPHALATRGLILAPAGLVVAGLCAALAWNAPLAETERLADAPQSGHGGLDAINVATDRSQADATAMAQAQGMKQAAAKLEQAAAALQQVNADPTQQQAALDAARQKVGELPAGARPVLDLPAQVPPSDAAKKQLARELSAAAGALRVAAEEKTAGADGQPGGQAEPKAEPVTSPQFVAFPRPGITSRDVGTMSEIAAQSPARRQLVQRALAASK